MDELKNERKYWLALSACNGIGPIRFEKLLQYFGSAKKAWNATFLEVVKSGIGEKTANDFEDFRKTFSLEDYEEKMHKLQVTYFTLLDDAYPLLLKTIKRAPPVLYKKGTYMFNKNDVLVSVVGTRKITEYGKEVTNLLVSELVSAGCIIVSGLAMGVDAQAHKSTLAAGGVTIAVLGSGVDIATPAENTALYEQILAKGGAIVSETPIGQMPNKGSFPARNRIIAGLSQGVVVTEGAEDSGSLITANDAFAFDRTVFAVPGPITSSVSKGPIALITKGAKVVMRGKDILEELNIKSIKSIKGIRSIKGDTTQEQTIIDLLQDQNLHVDEIIKRTGLTSSEAGVILSLMEVKGLIKSLESGFFGLTT